MYIPFNGALYTAEARKLEHDRLPTPDQGKKENQHGACYTHAPTFRSLLYCTILYHTIYDTVLHFTTLYFTILYYTILYYIMLCYTILYCFILYHAILYYGVCCRFPWLLPWSRPSPGQFVWNAFDRSSEFVPQELGPLHVLGSRWQQMGSVDVLGLVGWYDEVGPTFFGSLQGKCNLYTVQWRF